MKTLNKNVLTHLGALYKNIDYKSIDLDFLCKLMNQFLYEDTNDFTKFETKRFYPVGTKSFLRLSFRNTRTVV